MQSNEKKKGFDWMFAKPVDEVKDHWVRWAATISIYRSIVVAKSFDTHQFTTSFLVHL
jgi:hypothetical protein